MAKRTRKLRVIKPEYLKKLNNSFKELSKALQGSTTVYALFRGCLYPLSESEYMLALLASDEDGNWKKVELQINFDVDDILYEKKVVPLENTRNIMIAVDNVLNDLDKIPISFERVYFDLNHTVDYAAGYLESLQTRDVILLDNLQCYETNYCFSDAITVVKDKELVSGWKPIQEDDRWNE